MKNIMRNILCIIAGSTVIASFAACGQADNSKSSRVTDSNDQPPVISSSIDLLNTVWFSYNEDEKIYVVGGDVSGGNAIEGAPGVYSVSDSDALDRTLGFPASCIDKIDNAASLVHMMNANTFTCGAFHLKASSDSSEVAASIRDNILQRHWLDGFPDKYVIAATDDYIVLVWGYDEFVNTFRDKLVSAYPVTEILTDALIE